MAVVGSKGHVATFDWQTGTMHSELQLQETCRDITYASLPRSSHPHSPDTDGRRAARFLQDHSHYAVAQKKYVFIYDRDGVELHRLKSHIEPTRLEFLPYHWLLASVVRIIILRPLPPRTSLTARAGQHRLPQVPRHLDRPARLGPPHEARRVPHDGAGRAHRRHPPRAPERHPHPLDAEPRGARRAPARARRPRLQRQRRPGLRGEVRGDRGRRRRGEGVGL